MNSRTGIFAASFAGTVTWLMTTSAMAGSFSIPGGTLASALDAYSAQSGVQLAISSRALQGVRSSGVSGEMSSEQALSKLLSGTGFMSRQAGESIAIVRSTSDHTENVTDSLPEIQFAQATSAPRTTVETVTVTSSKLGGADLQTVPIAITALSQEQLTATQTAGGPDLIKQVPNMTFTKTNFSGYSIQLRGIGTQAISVTTDPAVAVAFNDIPFIRNHFFEQEFYDLGQVEVLRGPQGTLYGRNATAGVVNLSSAKPTDQFEAMASFDAGNYHERRPEGMINIPIVDDRLDIRIAGEWTKRQGYAFNSLTDSRIDGRNLWSGRVTIGWKPSEKLQTYLIWEHFSESDDRLRSSKQLCKTDPGLEEGNGGPNGGGIFSDGPTWLSQGCLPTSLYSPDAFQVPNGFSLPYIVALEANLFFWNQNIDPYASTTQSPNLRVIQSTINPSYKSKNDTAEFNAEYNISPTLTFISQTGFNEDHLFSTEDYNRFDTTPGIFTTQNPRRGTEFEANNTFCDPQLGCSNRLVAEDLDEEHAWQLSQEFRVASKFSGPLNFSAGGNYLHYETEENYYVFINSLSLYASAGPTFQNPFLPPWVAGVSDNHECLMTQTNRGGYQLANPVTNPSNIGGCIYIDPNPIDHLNNKGHNYFLSQNPYVLNSYAAFGEVYYNVLSDLKLTGGLRWTEDQKHFTDIPSELLTTGYGYGSTGVVNQQWDQFTGRFVANWTPKLDFTDQTLIYSSYSHGYKAGGANPPGAALIESSFGGVSLPDHPATFKPEFIDASELGTKNTLLDGALTLNGDVFYYNYENYQISEIVDRTSINLNFDTHVKGAELEATYEPIPGLRFNFGGGWESTALAKGSQSIDLIDRTAGHAGWLVVKPFITQASNCILPTYVLDFYVQQAIALGGFCALAYTAHDDPLTSNPYVPFPFGPDGLPGFNPLTAPNNGEGFDKDLSHHELPNAPPFTVSFGTQYTIPLSTEWAGTLRGDYYWQDYSWARVFNDNPYDRIRGYTSINLTLIFTNQNGWQVMLYDKNVFNETAITGDFLNSDDSGLTTNVFLTDPKLIGIRVTKNW